MNNKNRCSWLYANGEPPECYINYHDEEWGTPLHDDKLLFEFLILEGAQAGLSWITILKKRDNYRRAYDGFDPEIVAKYCETKEKELLNNPGIVRNKLKIASSIINAKSFLAVQKEFGSFDKYIWQFTDEKIIKNSYSSLSEMPTKTIESDNMSKDLKKRGFKFVGSTICYAFMQATGMVNDHMSGCFLH